MPTLPSSAFAQPHVLSPISLHCVPNFSSLSLPIKRKMEGHDEFGLLGEHFDPMGMGRNREDEYESRSGSDNLDGASGDDQDGGGAGADQQSKKKKKYHRHTPQQIQELEAFFKEYPHPDEKQRMELSRRLRLESKQIKFWFQNRRTQMKTQVERHENMILRQENDRLRAENVAVKNAMNSPICNNCGGPGILGDISYEEHQLRIENARLKEEVNRICSLANKFLGRPLSSLPSPMSLPSSNSGLELAMGRNEYGGFSSLGTTLPMGLDMGDGVSSASLAPLVKHEMPIERSVFLELGMAAMEELIKKAQVEAPLWTSSLDGGNEVFNHEEYLRTCSPCFGVRPNGFVSEASRDTGAVIVNSLALVETLMDANRWAEMFPCLVSRAFTVDVISNGIGGTKNGAMLLMHAELRVLSPLVPPRQMRFIRFCKQHAEGVWAVVDVSIDHVLEGSNAQLYGNCRRLPSGCIMHDMPNGYSKVTWVEHSEFDENAVHHLYRPLITNGIGFGARRWVATLQRHCECLAILMSSTMSGDDQAAINSNGRRSMLKLAQRMTDNFCSGVCASTARKWDKLQVDNVGEDVMVMTRKSMDDPGEPPGVVLSASTSVWMPLSQQRLFDFLRDERLRSEWDILSNGGPMQEMVHIAKGQGHGNCVSLLRANAANGNDSGMLILQETWTDASGSLVVYAPVDIPSMSLVMNGGDSAYVALLPSGFSITPCSYASPNNGASAEGGSDSINNGGSLLTVGFQILVSSLPTAKLTVESVETVNNLISCTIQKIKSSLQVS